LHTPVLISPANSSDLKTRSWSQIQCRTTFVFSQRVHCWLQSGTGSRSVVVSTPGSAALRDHVVAVFGSRTADQLQSVQAAGPGGLQISG